MPRFGKTSMQELSTCHPNLQKLFNEIIKHWDCKILEGRRSKDRQNQLFKEGRSKIQWPNGKHNVLNPKDLSRAVDVVPWPIIWPDKKINPEDYVKDLGRLYMFVGYVEGIAQGLGINIRVGADWDGDKDLKDQNFDDLPHFELI